MSAIVPYVSFISQYIPAAVKDAAGLCPQISESVRHITWLSVDRVFWPGAEAARSFLVLGYVDGFQLWDLQDPSAAREVLSKKANWGILQAKILPVPMPPASVSVAAASFPGAPNADAEGQQAAEAPIGTQHAPLLAYQRQGVPNVVRLFSLRSHDDVHLLRLIEPARSLQASRRYFAVGYLRQAEIYDALTFEALFSVQCSEGPAFALGHRWLAYNLPPQQSVSAAGGGGLLSGGARQLPTVMRDGVRYLGQVGQRTLDSMLMPLPEGAEQAPAPAARAGVVAVRDVAARGAVIAQFEDHLEPVEVMAWDPSGLQLFTALAQGHQVLVHRALLGAEQALVLQEDSAGCGLASGGVVFQHLYTLSRGVTPAVICDIAVSDNGQFVAVSSAKGTTHVFHLPPLNSAALGHHCFAEQGAVRLAPMQPCTSSPPGDMGISMSLGGGSVTHRPVTLNPCTRVRLGSVLLQEGLMPKCGFAGPLLPSSSNRSPAGPADSRPRMFVATRAATVQLYTLFPGQQGGSSASGAPPRGVVGSAEGGAALAGPEGGDWQAILTRETQVWRQLAHFAERRLSAAELAGGHCAASPSKRAPDRPSPRALSASPSLRPQAAPGALGAAPTLTLGPQQAGSSATAGGRSSSSRASPPLGPRSSPAGVGPASRSPALGPSEPSRPVTSGWAVEVETATHSPVEVPLWLCPQLSFHTYPRSAQPTDVNAAVRSGKVVRGRRRLAISRPQRLGDGVQYRAAGGEEQLSDALGAALAQASGSPRCGGHADQEAASLPVPSAPPLPHGTAEVSMAPAWGAVGLGDDGVADPGSSLLQADGVGCGLEEVVEDWLMPS